MAEILIRVVDKVQPDPELAALCLKAGHVVTIQPDGWEWSHEELTNPQWRIISVPLLGSHIDTLMAGPNEQAVVKEKIRRRRRFDLSALPLSGRFTGPRTQSIVTVTRPALLAAVLVDHP